MLLLHPNSTRHNTRSSSKPTLSRRSSLGSDIFGPLSRKTSAPAQFPSEEFRFTSITPQRSRSPASTIAPSSVDLHPPARPEDTDLGSFIVISGGTGCNAICEAFGKDASYVLPVSDNGGSSSEIIRVLGGPSIGDIRSRLVRLIPPLPAPGPAIHNLLSYRFPSNCTEREARELWRDIVEGKSKLWTGIPPDRKETIRGFLVYFESELLKRAHKNFCFRNGSLGNYFLAAAQGFFRSLPSAIFLFSSITGSQAHVLPVLVTSHFVTIAAELGEGAAAYQRLEARINPLRGVASAIAKSASIQAKILLLNGQNDRETEGYSAEDYIHAIARVLNRHDRLSHKALKGTQTPDFLIRDYPISAFITHVVYLRGSSVAVDEVKLAALGVRCVEMEGPPGDKALYDPATVRRALSIIQMDQVARR
ncbi:hypothetical protein FRC07_000654 [Ceratobasidium sp. 392]|nr:hypothetical protein FRC07_000654 [Ceratobasidium sp. 392]